MNEYTPQEYASLLYEKVIIIKYRGEHSQGLMIVKSSFYEKKINKFNKALKNCEIYYMSQCILTEDILKEVTL